MTDSPPPSAVVLLSGGLDSYTAAAIARADGFSLFALTVRYGQVHACELDAARRVARALGVARHLEIEVDLAAFGGSSLTGDGAVEQDRPPERPGIPATYVPARNTVLLSLALGWAEVLGAADLVIGVNALDYSGYPDCRPEYLEAFERLARLATRAGVEGGAVPRSRPPDRLDEGADHRPGGVAGARLRPHPQLLRPRAGRPPLRPLRQLPAPRPRLRRGRADGSADGVKTGIAAVSVTAPCRLDS